VDLYNLGYACVTWGTCAARGYCMTWGLVRKRDLGYSFGLGIVGLYDLSMYSWDVDVRL